VNWSLRSIPSAEMSALGAEELRSFLACKFAKWQVPDEFIFVPSLPHTSTGKLLKSELRTQFQHWEWSSGTAD
jgi:fatty-acyl-CoA synthase